MKIIFFGTSKFAVSTLRELEESGYSVVAVVTQPDKKSGRSLKVSASPVKGEAKELRLPIYQPQDVAEKAFIGKLKSFGADFFVVVAFGTILPKDILDIPKMCSLNVHASLLPKYRGAAPINRAVVNGAKKTGVTIIRMNERMDAGDIILQKEIRIKPNDTSEKLDLELADIGAELLIKAIEAIKKGKARFTAQEEKAATFAPKLTKQDGKIDWSLDAEAIINRIRGLKPWPGAYTVFEGHALKIIAAEQIDSEDFSCFSPGEAIPADEKTGLIIATGNGAILVLQLQLEGKKAMSAELFLRGHKIKAGTRLG